MNIVCPVCSKMNALYNCTGPLQKSRNQVAVIPNFHCSFPGFYNYLLSLNMAGTIKPFEPVLYARIAQLSNKSNQFNLTTHRYTREEIAGIAADENYIDLCGRLEDRFGDNGIVSVVIGHTKNAVVNIESWIMSCRVLRRNMEYAMMDEFVASCKERGIETIVGWYYPTAKNKMVRNFYSLHGFEKTMEDSEGNTKWELRVSDYTPGNHVIRVNGREL